MDRNLRNESAILCGFPSVLFHGSIYPQAAAMPAVAVKRYTAARRQHIVASSRSFSPVTVPTPTAGPPPPSSSPHRAAPSRRHVLPEPPPRLFQSALALRCAALPHYKTLLH
ncbi:hypothetical protein ABZP36_006963 [Zizania latifolia]